MDNLKLEDLEKFYLNSANENFDREHAFVGYWKHLLKENRSLSDDELQRLLTFKEWKYATSEIVQHLCLLDALTDNQINIFLRELAGNQFSVNQLLAVRLINDNEIAWETKLVRLLELKTDWAVKRLISRLKPSDVQRTKEYIAESKRPRRAKNMLLEYLNAQIKEIG